MSSLCIDHYREKPPVHPIAYHAGPIQEGRRISEILAAAYLDLKDAWKAYLTRHADRQAFQHLLGLDDAQLKDIGVTRSEVHWANSLPLSQNAAAELEILARQKRHL